MRPLRARPARRARSKPRLQAGPIASAARAAARSSASCCRPPARPTPPPSAGAIFSANARRAASSRAPPTTCPCRRLPPATASATDVPPPAAGLALALKVENMWCPACAWLIETALARAPGVLSAACSFATDQLRVRYDPVATDPDRITAVVQRFGYCRDACRATSAIRVCGGGSGSASGSRPS
ncbi:MAG: heavy-metal-associated domain-containing protein [Desulfobacterales bacterium]|nr:heavy-metal-associated domain-containing protein [Desulfobacterales bacterium]